MENVQVTAILRRLIMNDCYVVVEGTELVIGPLESVTKADIWSLRVWKPNVIKYLTSAPAELLDTMRRLREKHLAKSDGSRPPEWAHLTQEQFGRIEAKMAAEMQTPSGRWARLTVKQKAFLAVVDAGLAAGEKAK